MEKTAKEIFNILYETRDGSVWDDMLAEVQKKDQRIKKLEDENATFLNRIKRLEGTLSATLPYLQGDFQRKAYELIEKELK